ncbi:acyltransferase family protein [Niallia sp. Krafla_26]|uniref:acyltransferase family protein n=1 Tax=Niallia sp. Krafla_26 TaxID=3064703 RepID=UPI003D177D09
MNNHRDNTLDIAKGIAIFLVVFGHILQYTVVPTGIDFFKNPLFEVIYSFHMPLFMFVSGYLSTFSLQRRSLKDNFKIKTNGILIPYILWTIILVLITLLLKHIIVGETINVIGFLKMLVANLIVYPNIWFLYVLFLFYCILYFTIYMEKKIGVFSYIISAFFIILIPFKIYFGIYYIQFFYLFFLAGYLINCYKLKYNIRSVNKKFAKFIILLLIYLLLMSQWGKSDYIYVNLMKISSDNLLLEILRIIYRFLVAFVGIFLVLFISNFISRFNISSILKKMGTYSLDIYMIQNIIVSLIYRELIKVSGFQINDDQLIIFCFMVTIISITLCVNISKYIIRKMEMLNKLLLGRGQT